MTLSQSSIMESSTDSYRNPSPPPSPTTPELRDHPNPLTSPGAPNVGPSSAAESSEEGDRIGETVFSKSWALSLLVKTLQCVSTQSDTLRKDICDSSMQISKDVEFVEKEESSKVDDSGANEGRLPAAAGDCLRNGEACNADDTVGGHERREGQEEGEMDPSLEEELCLLWDASMNPDMVEYLHGNQSADLLLGVAARTNLLRLKEISIGIIGNMACVSAQCRESLCIQHTMDDVLALLGSEDTQVLIETTRLISSCLSQEEPKSSWLQHIKETASETMLQLLSFILKSSTNDDLIQNAASLLDSLMDGCDELLKEWSTEMLADAICEAVEQTSVSAPDVSGSLILSLQLFTTSDKGISSLGSLWNKVAMLSLNHLCTLDHIDPSNCSSALAAASLLEGVREQGGVGLTIDEQQLKVLLRLESEVCDLDSRDCPEQFPMPLGDLKRILHSLVSL